MYGIFNLDNQEEKSGWRQKLRVMFGKGSQEKAKMVLVEGSPGIGKTTFCLKIANDWAMQAIPKKHGFPVFKLILLLKCRDMEGDIIQAIDDQLLPDDITEKKKKELLDYIRDEKKQEKILIILDGLDELPKVAENFVEKLLRRKVLSHCSVLATTRQEKGIKIRQRHVLDTLLQINGFTIEDASVYITKHFSTVGQSQADLLKGQRLIQAIQENTFLHALRNNPLNLLLLCIVFEEYKGELPSNRTDLYQIIYRCLLRRYCSKNNMEVDKKDDILEKRFERSTLVLGELAWRCLLDERPSFLQEELDELEKVRATGASAVNGVSASNGVLATSGVSAANGASAGIGVSTARVGLVFMEASVKKLNPKHEYHFLHRTFQEFLAATYLVQLMKENIKIFDKLQLSKQDITSKYRQVFVFAAGILGKDGTTLFRHIGEILYRSWNWHSSDEHCRFLIELLNESGAPNDLTMVSAVCQCIPLSQSLELSLEDRHTLRLVRYACEASSVASDELILTNVHALSEDSAGDLHRILESNDTLKALVISTDDVTSLLANTLLKGLSSNLSLSSLTLKTSKSIPADVADTLGTGTSLCNSLTTLKLKLFSDSNAWARDVRDTGLLKSTQLESVDLEYYGVPGSTAVQGFKLLVSKRSLISFSVTLFGDMEDCLASALSEGLSEEITLSSFTVVIHGSLSNHGATLLAHSFLLNKTLQSLAFKVLGDLPENWTGVVDKIHRLTASKSWKSLTLHPNIKGKFGDASFSLLNPILRVAGFLKKTLTLNLWGELNVHNVDILGDLLLQTLPLSSLTLNVNGKVTNNVADHLVNFFVTNNVLLSLTFNLSGKIASSGQTAMQRLHREGQLQSFILNVGGLVTEDWECLSAEKNCPTSSALQPTDISNLTPNEVREILSGSESLTASSFAVDLEKFLVGREVLGRGLSNNKSSLTLSFTVHNNAGTTGSWEHILGEGLSNNKSLVTFSLTVHDYACTEGRWRFDLGEGLSNNKSLTSFSPTVINYADTTVSREHDQGEGLSNNKPLTTFSLTVHNYADTTEHWGKDLAEGLSNNKSLITFSLTIHNYAGKTGIWEYGLGVGLSNSKSLTTFSLTIHNYAGTTGILEYGLCEGLSKNKSLTTFSLAVHNYAGKTGIWEYGLGVGLSNNKSLTTFSLAVHNYAGKTGSWGYGLGVGLSNNKSLTTFSLTVHNYDGTTGSWGYGLGVGLSNNESLTTFSLTVHNYAGTTGRWKYGLDRLLSNNKSLTTFSLTVHSYADKTDSWGYGLGEGLSNNKSLTTFSLTVYNYAGTEGRWGHGLGEGLSNNNSLTTFSLTVHDYAGREARWEYSLVEGLSNNNSLTTFSLTVHDYAGTEGRWGYDLGEGLSNNKSLTSFSLTVHNYADTEGSWGYGLGEGLSNNKSLTSFSLTVHNYADTEGSWGYNMADSLAKSCSLTTLRLAINDHTGVHTDLEYLLRKSLNKIKSLSLLSISVSFYGEDNVELN